MSTPIENIAALTIGTVESVSPNEIKVLLELDAPQATALNTGIPSGFPRINGYLLIPNESGAVVGMIVWLGVERSAFPKRTGFKDFGLIDLPFPLRKICLTPVGTLITAKEVEGKRYSLQLKRGVSVFPSIGDPVLIPTGEQLRSIIEAHGAEDKRIQIGTSPLAAHAVVSVDPDKLFGRHLAVLGNTGSGKSCTVAGLIRWSLEKAAKERNNTKPDKMVNARFIILDPNGEYRKAFLDLGTGARIFKVSLSEEDDQSLLVPAWMWNSQEWSAFSSAAPGSQQPLLLQALRDMRAGEAIREPIVNKIMRCMRSYKFKIEPMIAQGVNAYSGFPGNKNCGVILKNIATDAIRYREEAGCTFYNILNELAVKAQSIADAHSNRATDPNKEYFRDFSETDLMDVLSALDAVINDLPVSNHLNAPSEDAPIPFEVGHLPDHLEQLASDVGGGQVAQFVAYLAMRIRMMLADRRLGPIVDPKKQPTFDQWLMDYIGSDGAANGPIAILDLSLVPSDVLHVIIAVIARIVFEATQRYRKVNNQELPTVLVLEEAHNFIQRNAGDEGGILNAAQMCRRTFERIAREGRKFGLGLVLSSQRPSELSATVLAQCNTFILHRIVNDRDQELVSKLVPDNLGGLLRELPSLPARQAILLGWAAPIPVLIEVNELPREHCPQSWDPQFWDVWTGKEERSIDWKKISRDWTS